MFSLNITEKLASVINRVVLKETLDTIDDNLSRLADRYVGIYKRIFLSGKRRVIKRRNGGNIYLPSQKYRGLNTIGVRTGLGRAGIRLNVKQNSFDVLDTTPTGYIQENDEKFDLSESAFRIIQPDVISILTKGIS